MIRGMAICIALGLATLPAAAAEYRRPNSAQLEDIRRWLCPHGGSPVKGVPGRCDGAGRRRGGASVSGIGSPAPGWDRGLPAASHEQMACPEGTRPVLARGHGSITRCLPG
ncbi:hypothetical protein [Pseudoroseomonas ludipueritiae]|uniref:Uncharacterized protein n=2 Tax=Pseudoroseomonas ludipueritiae TaxID=198093 RepID=A0ABR7R5G9_9PROT|nr:hypothetical protein [Pseudoroseomonas ludipueritiae]MBC9176880.1 hypothetical protein [Pseudoroseomonas ludipueritiae]MCG7362024.1 hypothetical protein [Roseomonas sp. ACRSG]